ncbi:MAG TPA: OmpA family protein [Polyangiaceae bacterium]
MKIVAVACLLAVAVPACSNSARNVRSPAALHEPPSSIPAPIDKSPSRATINIAADIRRACGIAEADAHFPFDSSRVSAADYPTLDKLVACFSSGALAARPMRLVGHADPRGDEEYNFVLAASRADGVKIFLLNRGLRGAQMHTVSRGEIEARGSDEASWAEDRRVDISLAN